MTRTILPLAIIVTSLFVSCEDENEPAKPVAQPGLAQFENSDLSLAENTGTAQISIALNRNAADDGELSIRVTSSNIEQFQFNPAPLDGLIKLPFFKGQSKISFDVTSVDNDIIDGDKTIDFKIESITPGYVIGTRNTLASTWVDDETPARVNFELSASEAWENGNAGYPVTISFSHTAAADGIVRVSIESANAVYGTHFTTTPAASNGSITLEVERGKNQVAFTVFPIDDNLFKDHRSITYTIAEVQGGLDKGEQLQHDLKITDDELHGIAKGYETFAGGWGNKKRYEYNEDGRISKVHWEQGAPGNHVGGVYTYVYDANGQLNKIVKYAGREEIFIREGGRIIKSEEYTNNVLTKYTLYGYDAAGNVGEAAVHYRQPDGTLKLSSIFVYLYHFDHNLYKILTHSVVDGFEEPVLNNTKTYDHYIDVENQFPLEILPGQKSQNKLPGSFRLEEGGQDITYQFTYQFSTEGRPLSRTATSPSGSETAYYEYY